MQRRFLLLALSATAACTSGVNCSGCSGIAPLPNLHFESELTDSVAAAHLSPKGFDTLNTNSSQLLDALAPGGYLAVPLECSIQSATILGLSTSIALGDEGGFGCTNESCGQLDGKCDAFDRPRTLFLNVSSVKLAPRAPDQIGASFSVRLATGKIMVSTVNRNSPLCAFTSPAKCSLNFDTSRAAPGTNDLTLNVRFTYDTKWDKLLTFEVAGLDGSAVCGSGESPPSCIDTADLTIGTEGSCVTCGLANWSVIKSLLLDRVAGILQQQLSQTLHNRNCRSCTDGLCPQTPTGHSECRAHADSGVADAGFCFETGTFDCTPAMNGVEGRVSLASVAPGVFPEGSVVDLSLAAGGTSTATPDAGLTLGFRGGIQTLAVNPCVKPLPSPAPQAIALPDFDPQAPGPYDVGVSVSQQMLARALYQAHQSGALCAEISHSQVALLDSRLLGTLLPSLNRLVGAKNDSEGAALRVVIRPTNVPTVTVGAGLVEQGAVKTPLLTLSWQELQLDVYVYLDDRYVRLFSLTADLTLPLALGVEGCSSLTVMVGDLSQALTNVHSANSEILAEGLTAIEALAPTLVSMAEPQLASALSSIALPSFQGWQVKLLAARGVGPISGTSNFNHVGVYGNLVKPGDACVPVAPKMRAVVSSRSGSGVELRVESGLHVEYSYRIDSGLWSMYRPADAGRLNVVHPRLLLGGSHTLDVRSRDVDTGAISPVERLAVGESVREP